MPAVRTPYLLWGEWWHLRVERFHVVLLQIPAELIQAGSNMLRSEIHKFIKSI